MELSVIEVLVQAAKLVGEADDRSEYADTSEACRAALRNIKKAIKLAAQQG
jgi:hypothetical protein